MSTRLVDRYILASPAERFEIFSRLSLKERHALLMILESELKNPWARFEHSPVGFIEVGIGETLWSKQKEILQSLQDNKRTAVPACHAPGKTHLAARAISWWMSVHPPGTAIAISTAPTFRQVRNIMWANLRRVHIMHDLPGEILTNQWKMDGTVVAYGFAAKATDESAIQGIHAPHLLIVVDEAGGISDTIGNAMESLMTGGHTRMLVLGNPPTEDEQSWFERICESSNWNVIRIPADATPNFTGEEAGICKSCPPIVESHNVALHLVDKAWVDDVISEFGEDSPFVIARVHAEFPKSGVGKVIPYGWIERAETNEEYLESDVIKLGADIASDGGDEFAIGWIDGYVASIVHKSSGAANANAVDVAAVIWGYAIKAVDTHKERKVKNKVRVKIDKIGVGWGVVSILEKWVKERKMGAFIEIVGVNVAERPQDVDKFKNQRAEMWWNGRTLMQPNKVLDEEGQEIEVQDIKLDVDRQVMAQLSGPKYKNDSAGRISIESKVDMKKRGVRSPDQAEAILLGFYEPKAIINLVAPTGVTQENPWAM